MNVKPYFSKSARSSERGMEVTITQFSVNDDPMGSPLLSLQYLIL